MVNVSCHTGGIDGRWFTHEMLENIAPGNYPLYVIKSSDGIHVVLSLLNCTDVCVNVLHIVSGLIISRYKLYCISIESSM